MSDRIQLDGQILHETKSESKPKLEQKIATIA